MTEITVTDTPTDVSVEAAPAVPAPAVPPTVADAAETVADAAATVAHAAVEVSQARPAPEDFFQRVDAVAERILGKLEAVGAEIVGKIEGLYESDVEEPVESAEEIVEAEIVPDAGSPDAPVEPPPAETPPKSESARDKRVKFI